VKPKSSFLPQTESHPESVPLTRERQGGLRAQGTLNALTCLGWLTLSACLGNPIQDESSSSKSGSASSSSSGNTSAVAADELVAQEASGTRVRFHALDFYGLTYPHPSTRCAGDARTYLKLYDVNASSGTTLADEGVTLHADYPGNSSYSAKVDDKLQLGPVPFDKSTINTSQTLKPNFIRDVAVDITDASASVGGNNASSCSLPSTAVPTSHCATFDFGNAGGLPSSLGGTLLLIGGLHTQTTNLTTTEDDDSRIGFNYAGLYDDNTSTTPYTNYLGSSAGTSFSTSPKNRSHTVSCGPQAPSSVLGSTNTYEYFVNRCDNFMFTLGVDRLPASAADGSTTSFAPGLKEPPADNEPITIWGNLKPTSATTVAPRFVAGATAAYSPSLNQVMLFGGSAPIGMTSATTESTELAETWIYDLKKQTWEKLDSISTSDALITRHLDSEISGLTTTVYEIERDTPGRAYFGAAAVPYVAVAGLSGATGSRNWTVDTTERILSVGGNTSGTEDRDTHRFNPTFGPEYQDAADASTAGTFPTGLPASASSTGAVPPVQWIESNPTTVLTNKYFNFPNDSTLFQNCFTETANFGTTELNSLFSPKLPYFLGVTSPPSCLATSTTLSLAIGQRTTTHSVLGLFGGTTVLNVVGHFMSLGGFTAGTSQIQVASTPSTRPEVLWRTQGADGQADDHAAQFSFVANLPDGTRKYPGLWHPLGDSGTQPLRWFGATQALPGYNRGTDVVYFGGTFCSNFATDASDSSCTPGATNPGALRRYTEGDLRSPLHAPNSVGVTALAVAGSPPTRAGMAAARGYTSAGAPIVVAWGGLDRPLFESAASSFHILTFNAGTGNGTWQAATTLSDAPSPGITYGQMVYSHVMRKFYLFGGLQYASSTLTNLADTYEITVSGTSAPFTATFRKLTPKCTPSCPPARRGHRMMEVNYNADPTRWAGSGAGTDAWRNFTPGSDALCTAAAPCSFGIFMEGGTSTGTNLLGDRWMFDPTANGGEGLWQRVDSFPARKLAMSAPLEITPATDVIAGVTAFGKKNYVLLFGGESGLANPAAIPTPSSGAVGYVAPTFGDTWLFDFSDKKWHRVRLAGKGYTAQPLVSSGYTEAEAREGYLRTAGAFTRPATYSGGTPANTVTDPTLPILTPPPLSGGMMVVRTHNGPIKTSDPTQAGKKLRIPEVFLIGGRLKNGALHPFSDVYKFCVGTTGERLPTAAGTADPFNDSSCDAYDPEANPESTSPTVEYIGRWLQKKPYLGSLTGNLNSYLGAAAYNPEVDRIGVFGGLSDDNSILESPAVRSDFFEYTPPTSRLSATGTLTPGAAASASDYGSWASITNCALNTPTSVPSPEPRYGHTMNFDQATHQYVIVGGYDATGKPLTTSITSTKTNTSYTSPQIWVGKRLDSESDLPFLGYNGYEVDTASVSYPCMVWREIKTVGNHPRINSQAPPQGTLAHSTSVYIPPTGYNTGYYSLFDHACDNAGPFNTGDSASSRKFAGGAYIELDRTKLGSSENVLLHLKFIPLTENQVRPDGEAYTSSERAVLNVHLVTTSQSEDSLLSVPQPRHFQYANPPSQIPAPYPEVDHSFSVFARPDGMLREEQILIPLSSFPTANRIRIERESGSAILIDATIIRLGRPEN
jgi:hypothetical protein